MSDLSFTTAPTRRESAIRRMRGALVFLALLLVATAVMFGALESTLHW